LLPAINWMNTDFDPPKLGFATHFCCHIVVYIENNVRSSIHFDSRVNNYNSKLKQEMKTENILG
jgi:hypothetical protein